MSKDTGTITVDEASADLAELLKSVAQGEGITITKDGMPVARLVPVHKKRSSLRERARAVRRIRRLSTSLSLGRLVISELIEEGRR